MPISQEEKSITCSQLQFDIYSNPSPPEKSESNLLRVCVIKKDSGTHLQCPCTLCVILYCEKAVLSAGQSYFFARECFLNWINSPFFFSTHSAIPREHRMSCSKCSQIQVFCYVIRWERKIAAKHSSFRKAVTLQSSIALWMQQALFP